MFCQSIDLHSLVYLSLGTIHLPMLLIITTSGDDVDGNGDDDFDILCLLNAAST